MNEIAAKINLEKRQKVVLTESIKEFPIPEEFSKYKEIKKAFTDNVPSDYQLVLDELYKRTGKKSLADLKDLYLEISSEFLLKALVFEDEFAKNDSARRAWKKTLGSVDLPAYKKLEDQRVRINSLAGCISVVDYISDLNAKNELKSSLNDLSEKYKISTVDSEKFRADYINMEIEERYSFVHEFSKIILETNKKLLERINQ